MPNSIVDFTSRWVPAEAEGFRTPERHAGDIRRAQELVDELGKKYPANSWLNTVTLPAARAAAEMRQGHHAHAVELLQPAAPYPSFVTTYFRGLAYLRAHSGREAAAEFQRILDHRGIAPFSPYYPLAYLGLARAQALTGDRAESWRSYERFFDLWKNADPDIPILRQAKVEYANLQ